MYAVFAFVDDWEFHDVCPNGDMTVHLFDTQQEALDWMIDILIDKGDILIHEDTYVLSEDWEQEGIFCQHYLDKDDALIAWQNAMTPWLFFHLAEVRDHR